MNEHVRRYKRYPKYKDSKVEWLGEVPQGWRVLRLRSTVTSCQNGVWGDEPDGIHDIPCVRVADFDRTSFRVGEIPTVRSIDPRAVAVRRLNKGDLLLEKSGGGELQPVGVVVSYDRETAAVCSNFIARMGVASGFDSRFLVYLHAALYKLRINTRSIKQSTGIQNLDSDSYLQESGAFPDLSEQRAIATFLDRETTKIDALMAKKERLIELLQEQRGALITRAVTKGLDLSVAMKNSGVDWIGDVPTQWGVSRIKFVARLRSGHTPSRQQTEYWQDCTIPWFGLADVWQIRDGRTEYVTETAEKISELGLANSAARLLPAGTVMLSRTASVGFSAIMGVPMATTQDFVNWVCGPRVRPEYLLYVFRAMGHEFNRLTMGSTHQTIYMPDVGRFEMPLPPANEQRVIVNFIREKSRKLESLVDKIQTAAGRLVEQRTALISAAVTGKIDVREEVA